MTTLWGTSMSQHMPHSAPDTAISWHWAAREPRQSRQTNWQNRSAPFQKRSHNQQGHLHQGGYPTFCTRVPETEGQPSCFALCRRIGEATKPGPDEATNLITIGQSNPSGLRGKHLEAAERGPGIWSYSETHLTSHTASSFSRALRALGRQQDRQIRIHTGHPVALRANSRWAGTWSGVLQHSDFPSRTVQTAWPDEIYRTGRLMMVRHIIEGLHMTIGTCYGYPRNPTWPAGHLLTNELLKPLTQQLVLGQSGIRLILGDFNQQEAGALDEQKIWMAQGWINAQSYAIDHFGHEWQPTSGSHSEVDQIWMSPEAAALCRKFIMQDVFSGHATIAVQLQMPHSYRMQWTWPLPSEIPWDKIADSKTDTQQLPEHTADATADLMKWAGHFETHTKQLAEAQAVHLPTNWQGRATRLKPLQQTVHTPLPKPSRQGELQLIDDTVGYTVRLWYKQARRIQSLQHAVLAAKMTPAAQLYRAELWGSIQNAEGFRPSFSHWWELRDPCFDTSPTQLPNQMPDSDSIVEIHAEFTAQFRKFEQWHNSQRLQQLKAKHERSHRLLYQELKPPRKEAVDILWHDKQHEIIATDKETNQIHVEGTLEPMDNSVWKLDDQHVVPTHFDGVVCTVPDIDLADQSNTLTQRTFVTNIEELHDTLLQHWIPKWQAQAPIEDDRWARITAFVRRFLPRLHFPLQPITLPQWKRAVRKLKTTAARGTDGIARSDLLHMTGEHTNWLLQLLDNVETGQQQWPQQWLTGIIHAIAKHDAAHTPSDYRPIHLFCTAYRLWASLRTKQTLRQMKDYVPEAAYGFLPGKETTQVWLTIQAWIEYAVNCDLRLCGLSTDLQKCFNNIERPQIFLLAEHLGISNRILRPWRSFLENFERRFCVRGTVGSPTRSTRGVAEGDPLSILAMVQINWSHHVYLEVYTPKLCCRSFVDNLCLMSQDVENLIHGMAATVSCLDLWGLSVDQAKTYVWGVDTASRKQLKLWDYAVMYDARSLADH